jgi:hypothetical protein
MDIHPWTNYEIARLRDEERLLRAQEARRVREVRQGQSAERGARRIEAAPIRLLRRMRRRKVAEALPQAGANAV